jgi:hypothetical protein
MFIPHQKYTEYSADTEGRVKGPRGKVLKVRPSNSGHSYYSIRRVNRSGHRFVFECFCGAIPDGLEINHKNGDKQDNRLLNLELATRGQNLQHAHDTGLIRIPKGVNNAYSKLTDEQVLWIREMSRQGWSQNEISLYVPVHQATVSEIVRRKRWKHLP